MTEHRKIDFCDNGEWAGPWHLLILSADPDEHGGFGWVNWTLFEVASVGDYPLFQRKGATSSPDEVDLGPDPSPEDLRDKAESTAKGHFKWDGCAEIRGLNIHVCCRSQWEGLVEILQKLPGLCQEHFAVPRDEEGGW